jgi:hypothetical protein
MTAYESYFTDFTGHIFNLYINENGRGVIPDDLRDYLYVHHDITRDEFTPSVYAFTWNETALNIVEYVDSLPENDTYIDDIYVVCPCHKKHTLPEINYQAIISGSPYYLGGPKFNWKSCEPLNDLMRREVKEETLLTLHDVDIHGNQVDNFDMVFIKNTPLPYLAQNTKLAIDYENIDIYGEWDYRYRVDRMTSHEIEAMEEKVNNFRANPKFNFNFVSYKTAIVVLGELTELLHFYTYIIHTIKPAPHIEIRPNDLGVLLIPLRLIYNRCQQHLKSKRSRSNIKFLGDQREYENLPITSDT